MLAVTRSFTFASAAVRPAGSCRSVCFAARQPSAASALAAPLARRRAPLAVSRRSTAVVAMAGKEVHLAAEGVAPFNGPVAAAACDSTAHGSERPGMKPEWDAPGAIPDSAVDEWVAHMKANGITRAMSLLSPEELTYYASPLSDQYGKAFNDSIMIDMKAAGAHSKAMEFLEAADAAGEKVVLHCAGGQGRTGLILASWLVKKHGMSPEDAVAQMMAYAAENKVSRADILAKLPGFIEKGSQ